MSMQNTLNTYGWMAKLFHWVVSLLIIVLLIVGFIMVWLSNEMKSSVYPIHKLTGLTVLFLVMLRLFWRSINVQPLLPSDTKPWEHFAERVVHYGLYFFAIAMPLVGWIGSCSAGHPPNAFGMELMLPFVPLDEELTKLMFIFHKWIAFILIGLVAVHVSAALFHHYVKKDNVLTRMLPGRD